MSLNYVTLILDLFDGQGNQVSQGWARITPSAQLTDTVNNQLVTQAPVVAQFRPGLTPQVTLLATDNGTLVPSGWGWTISFTDVPGNPATFSFFLPYAAGATQYLSSQAPVATQLAMAGYLPLAGGTMTGPIVLPGNPAAALQAAPKQYVDNHAGLTDWYNIATEGGAISSSPSSPVDTTVAIQAGFNRAVALKTPGYLPAGYYAVSQLTIPSGLVLYCDSAGGYPGNSTIPGVTVLARLAGVNQDLLTAPDGNNYFRIYDLAIDGNKNNNTSGMGLNVQDGAVSQSCLAVIERCYFHDNPGSNIYLGNNRLGSKIINSILNWSGTGDGVTLASADNHVVGCLIGDNARAGVCVGTSVTQNWAATTGWTPSTNHIYGCDIFKNNVGIAIASNVTRTMVAGNGIDRNNLQGITVYNGDCNVIVGNALHSNGQAADNTYGHIDLASGVTGVCIEGNTFGPIDGGITNYCSYCVVTESGIGKGAITGNIGVYDPSDTHGGLISTAGANSSPSILQSAMIVRAANSTQKAFQIENTAGTVLFSMTNAGSFTVAQGAGQFSTAQNAMGGTALASAVLSLVGTAAGVAQLKSQLSAGQTADIWDMYASNGSTLLAAITAAGAFQPGNGSAAGGHLYSGSGAPNIAGSVAGDFYFRTDTPSTANQRIYVATAANTWTGIV